MSSGISNNSRTNAGVGFHSESEYVAAAASKFPQSDNSDHAVEDNRGGEGIMEVGIPDTLGIVLSP